MEILVPRAAFNEKFLPYLSDETHRYLLFYGGAGSGKSVFAAQRFLCRLLGKPLCNLLAVRAVAATHRDSTYALLRQLIARWGLEGLFTCRDTEPRLTCVNGNTAVFKGLDDAEKLKSITFPKGELTDIWIEEASEISQGDFNQLDVRLRGRGAHKQMVLTFNPVSASHWLKARFFDRPDPRAAVVHSTYRDNRFLDEDYRRALESYRETDPYYYAVYCLGQWGVLGRTLFDAKAIGARLGELSAPVARGQFAWRPRLDSAAGQVRVDNGSIHLVEGEGPLEVFRRPVSGRAYVIGADTAGEGSDFNVAQVLDAQTGEQAAVLRAQTDEDLFARQLYCLGMYYNQALIAVEVNFSTYPIRELERLGYPRQYVRPEGKAGFRTTSATRPLLIAQLTRLFREGCGLVNHRETLEEALEFVRGPGGRPQAKAGAHDDCLMSLAIACLVREQDQQAGGEGSPFLSVGKGAPP